MDNDSTISLEKRIEDRGLREGTSLRDGYFNKRAIAYLTQKKFMMTNEHNKNVAERLIPSILNPQSSILNKLNESHLSTSNPSNTRAPYVYN